MYPHKAHFGTLFGSSKTDKSADSEIPKKRNLKVADIHFSQANIAKTFSTGETLKEVIDSLIKKDLKAHDFPSIRVVKHRNMWYTLDNRRLKVFKSAFIPEITVIECDFSDSKIKTEFFSKFSNKTLDGGGIERGYLTPAPDHYDSGAYKFIGEMLNWNFEQIKRPLSTTTRPEPLPNKFYTRTDYYESFLPLILEETRAILHAGIDVVEKGEAKFMKLSVAKPFKRPKNPKNPIGFTFDKNLKTLIPIKSSDALLLVSESEPDEVQLLGLASNVNDENPEEPRLTAKVVVDEYLQIRYPEAFEEHAKWRVYSLGNVVSQMRMYDACKTAPILSWMEGLLIGERSEKALSASRDPLAHLFSGMSLSDRAYSPYAARSLTTKKEMELSKTESEFLSDLNVSQQNAINKFLNKSEGIELIQGPPGTGKTTAITALLKILYSRKERTLVCAPSNKAVQLLAERFLAENPDAAIAFAGVEDKLPTDNEALNNVFIHTYGENKLTRLAEIDSAIWKLVPPEEFNAQEISIETIKRWTKVAKENLDFVEYSFEAVVKDLHRYQFSFIDSLDKLFNKYKKSAEAYHNFIESVAKCQFNDDMLSEAKIELSNMAQYLHSVQRFIQMKVADDSKTGLEGLILDRAIIIFATLSVTGRKSFKEMDQVSTLIIDEAGQAVEAETIIPLASKPTRCLLIGDIKQLPATVISPHAEKLNFRRSMMERLIEGCGQSFSLLDEQYRMHPTISAWPSFKYYDNKLKDAVSVHPKIRKLPELLSAPPFLSPYAFIDVAGMELSGGSAGYSFKNKVEAEMIVRLSYTLNKIYKIDVNKQVGVITFYKSQADLINESLKPHYPGVKVATVDGYQGSESDIIIISFVRANESGSIGFVQDFRRLNVALTRARYSVIMLGHAKTLERKVHDVAELISDAKKRSHFFTQDIVNPHLLAPTTSGIASTALSSKVCRFYNGAPGSCRKGDRCDFTHTGSSANTAKATSSIVFSPIISFASPEPKAKTQLCRHFTGAVGSCRFGDGCKFSHGSHQLAMTGAGFTSVESSSDSGSSYQDEGFSHGSFEYYYCDHDDYYY